MYIYIYILYIYIYIYSHAPLVSRARTALFRCSLSLSLPPSSLSSLSLSLSHSLPVSLLPSCPGPQICSKSASGAPGKALIQPLGGYLDTSENWWKSLVFLRKTKVFVTWLLPKSSVDFKEDKKIIDGFSQWFFEAKMWSRKLQKKIDFLREINDFR